MTVRSQFISRFFFITVLSAFAFQCKMADLNNPGDPLSEEFAKRSVFAEFVRYFLLEKALPDGLVLLLTKNVVPYEAGFRIYRVDPELGLTNEYDSDIRAANTAAFPGCDPVRIAVPPSSRDIVTFTGTSSNHLVVHRYGTDRSLSLLQDQTGLGSPNMITFDSTGTTMYHINAGVDPNTVNRSYRDNITGSISMNNAGSYPFGVGCSPVSIRTSDTDGIIFIATTVGAQLGINVHKKTGTDTTFHVGGAPFDPADNPTQNNNICLVEPSRFLYMTSVNPTFPIYGFRYDSGGNMQVLPSSPFSPDSSYSAAASVDNFSTSLTLDPNGKFAAVLYGAGGTNYLRILAVDGYTGNLTPTEQKLSVGNAPKHIVWDKSGKFIYLVSDTGGTTNKFQLEYFKFSQDGTLTKGVNSPITFSNMSGDFTPRDLKSIQRYYH
ncbi:hypothetical protein EHQ47_13090 [Leptospira bourretii]|uniref:beta-propeller fold lactonase family protein n=1 Tax=Leptospira bourretii TaxID=2484962 RepID=UPI0010914D1E|nr:beta-propeller fold lactonase family protein [Leptospira bourretii]TGL20481.1 hypothetical protein EHQ47_13090 [Leptospira bourretii]